MSTSVRSTVDFSTFPETDGEPMADAEFNQRQMINLIFSLGNLLEPRGHHVGGNLLIYYNQASGLPCPHPDEERAARIAAQMEAAREARARAEAEQARLQAEERAAAEAYARIVADARIAELEALLRSLEQQHTQDPDAGD